MRELPDDAPTPAELRAEAAEEQRERDYQQFCRDNCLDPNGVEAAVRWEEHYDQLLDEWSNR